MGQLSRRETLPLPLQAAPDTAGAQSGGAVELRQSLEIGIGLAPQLVPDGLHGLLAVLDGHVEEPLPDAVAAGPPIVRRHLHSPTLCHGHPPLFGVASDGRQACRDRARLRCASAAAIPAPWPPP